MWVSHWWSSVSSERPSQDMMTFRYESSCFHFFHSFHFVHSRLIAHNETPGHSSVSGTLDGLADTFGNAVWWPVPQRVSVEGTERRGSSETPRTHRPKGAHDGRGRCWSVPVGRWKTVGCTRPNGWRRNGRTRGRPFALRCDHNRVCWTSRVRG